VPLLVSLLLIDAKLILYLQLLFVSCPATCLLSVLHSQILESVEKITNNHFEVRQPQKKRPMKTNSAQVARAWRRGRHLVPLSLLITYLLSRLHKCITTTYHHEISFSPSCTHRMCRRPLTQGSPWQNAVLHIQSTSD